MEKEYLTRWLLKLKDVEVTEAFIGAFSVVFRTRPNV